MYLLRRTDAGTRPSTCFMNKASKDHGFFGGFTCSDKQRFASFFHEGRLGLIALLY